MSAPDDDRFFTELRAYTAELGLALPDSKRATFYPTGKVES